MSDGKLARILKNCRDLPGSELFQYVDENGQRHSIDSSDVNDYLRKISGREISAKDFRTWAGTNLAILAFCALKEEKPSKKSELLVIKRVAEQLGNTVGVCRKCYIHPVVITRYYDGSIQNILRSASRRRPGLSGAETTVRRLLASARSTRRVSVIA